MASDTPSRRREDSKIDEVLDRLDILETGQVTIVDAQVSHVEEYHAFKAGELRVMVAQHKELVHSVPVNTRLLENIIDVLEGKEQFDLQDVPKGRSGGMVGKQAMIERDVSSLKRDGNGGRGFSVRTRDKIIIGAIAAVPSIVLMVIAVIQNGQP